MDKERKKGRGHPSSIAYRFETKEELDNYILDFYAARLAYYSKNMYKETIYGVKVTPKLLKITRRRYLTLLMRKHNVTNGELPAINK